MLIILMWGYHIIVRAPAEDAIGSATSVVGPHLVNDGFMFPPVRFSCGPSENSVIPYLEYSKLLSLTAGCGNRLCGARRRGKLRHCAEHFRVRSLRFSTETLMQKSFRVEVRPGRGRCLIAATGCEPGDLVRLVLGAI